MVGLSEESAIITEYYVKSETRLPSATILFAIENGKATYDVTAEVSGYVLAILQEDGMNTRSKHPCW
ncbi:MAG: biotin/lipoyl-containing protein [Saccharofermentanales bacterium]